MFKSKEFDIILNEFNNKNNSHSYIFYTNDFFSCKKDVYELIKQLFGVDKVSNIENDFKVIEKSDKKIIAKEEVADIKDSLINTSYINKYRVFLIEEAHKLTTSSANVILKFLEEPMDGVITLFITDSLDSVIGTIKSRCQIINTIYEINDVDDYKDIEKFDNLLFNNDKYISLFNIKDSFKDLERFEIIEIFRKLINYYSNNNKEVNKIKVLNQGINMLSGNVNVDYVLDYVIIKGSD